MKQQCVHTARLRLPLCGCCWELRPIKAAALPYKYFGGWRRMTSCTAPTLSAKTKSEICLHLTTANSSGRQSTSAPLPSSPSIKIHRQSGAPGTPVCVQRSLGGASVCQSGQWRMGRPPCLWSGTAVMGA